MKFSNQFYHLGEAFYSRVIPRALGAAKWVALDEDVAALLLLDPREIKTEQYLAFFSGQAVAPSSKPLAMVYSGHQFGQWAGQLGDGRGILLGERRGKDGVLYDIHLKGAGQTPYSRFGDGHAVLRSCIREYLASIALHHLRIPSTHALCITRGDNPVTRETIEPAAILTRVARTHIRFGSFQHFFASGDHERLKQLADYALTQYFSAAREADQPYAELLSFVVDATAKLIAHWQAKGFAHGVMNTDNMSLLGETFDYGPFGFMENYNHYFVCNHSDTQGRYAFDQQPHVGLWNLYRFAESLGPLVDEHTAKSILDNYERIFIDHYYSLMGDKLGLTLSEKHDHAFIEKLIGLLHAEQLDYTVFFRKLSYLTDARWESTLLALCHTERGKTSMAHWLLDYKNRLKKRTETDPKITKQVLQHRLLMQNPKFILRNYLAQKAIDLAYMERDYTEINVLQTLLKQPFAEHPDYEDYAKETPLKKRNIAVSCSS